VVSAWGDSWGFAWGESWSAAVEPPDVLPDGGLGFLFRPATRAIEGVAYAELPELIGYAVGEVGNAVKARCVLHGFLARAAGEGFAARILPDFVGRSAGVIGTSGKAISTQLPLMVSVSMTTGRAGETKAILPICKGSAMGDHDPDEHTIIALMMAA